MKNTDTPGVSFDGAALRDNRFDGVAKHICDHRLAVAVGLFTLLVIGFWSAQRDFASVMVKVSGAMAVGTTLSGFMLGWINDATKSVQDWTDFESGEPSHALFKLQGQLVRVMRGWVGSVLSAVLSLVFSAWLERAWDKTDKLVLSEPALWLIGLATCASVALLVFSVIRLYDMMEDVMSQKFRIEHSAREFKRALKKP